MMEYKKLIAGFRCKDGSISSWDGSISYEGELKDLARFSCDNGADEIFVYDASADDADHEAVIAAIREAAREVDEPILGWWARAAPGGCEEIPLCRCGSCIFGYGLSGKCRPDEGGSGPFWK